MNNRSDREFNHAVAIGHSVVECLEAARQAALESGIRGLKVEKLRAAALTDEAWYPTLYIDFERSFAVGATLQIGLRPRPAAEARKHSDGRSLRSLSVEVEVEWSSCGREIPEALAAVALYRDVVELGADIQTVLERMRPIGVTDGSGARVK